MNFPDLIQYLGEREVVLDNLTTNGALLNERIIDNLMKVRVTDVRVSLNYPTAETWAVGMGLPAKQFERVVQNTRRLNEARRGNERFGELWLQFFIHKPTVHLIRESYALARELGADLVTYRELWDIDPALSIHPGDVPAIVDQMREIIREDWGTGIIENHLGSHGLGEAIGGVYEELRAELGGAPPRAPEAVNDHIRYCYIAWYSMTLLGSQAVYPCCYLLPNHELPPIGSLKEQTLGEVWRGAAYRRFRKEMRDYFMLQRQIPLFEKRTQRISASCASHTDCPITRGMCDEAFYEEADRRLDAVRRQPMVQAWRFVNRAGRVAERHLLR